MSKIINNISSRLFTSKSIIEILSIIPTQRADRASRTSPYTEIYTNILKKSNKNSVYMAKNRNKQKNDYWAQIAYKASFKRSPCIFQNAELCDFLLLLCEALKPTLGGNLPFSFVTFSGHFWLLFNSDFYSSDRKYEDVREICFKYSD